MTDAPLFASLKKPLPYTLIHSDCVDAMRKMPDASVDAVVCDPPYGLEFMGKEFDKLGEGQAQEEWHRAWCIEALRVLKPGGHLLAFGGTRTYHRLACAVEDAGFEIRDSVIWCYGSGFPKSLDVSKALDKSAGAVREVIEQRRVKGGGMEHVNRTNAETHDYRPDGYQKGENILDITAPATEAAKTWEGWGTALKPAFEPVVVGRKPLAGTVAENVLKHGTGALNIDGCRVAASDGANLARNNQIGDNGWKNSSGGPNTAAIRAAEGLPALGRWPANLLLSHSPSCIHLDTADDTDLWACVPGCPVRAMDAQSGPSGGCAPASGPTLGKLGKHGIYGKATGENMSKVAFHGKVDGASRFFMRFDPNDAPFIYQAKANTKDRSAGIEGRNSHPTVKSTALMAYLCRLVTPPGGVVLDPFMGSGSTGVAALREGFRFIGIEREQEYFDIATQRIEHAAKTDS